MKKFAVILSGCGRADGSEIHEATCALLAIDRLGGTYQCFAPNIPQAAVINILTGEKMPETRNVLVESARICRGDAKDIKEYNPADFDAIVFPGGFGAVTNWCDFAAKGVDCHVEPEIRRAAWDSYKQGLVIGAMCIAPVVMAKILGGEGVHLTIGTDKATAAAVEQMGAVHENRASTEVCVDEKHRLVTTPAYMLATSVKEVAAGAEEMVKAMLKLL